MYLKPNSVCVWDFNVKPKLTAWKQMCDHARNKCFQNSFQNKSYCLGLKLIFIYAWLTWWIGTLPENVQEHTPKSGELYKIKKYLIYYPYINTFLWETYAWIGTFFKISVKTVKGTCKRQMLEWCCMVLQNFWLAPFGTNGALWLFTVFITTPLKSSPHDVSVGFFFSIFYLTAI